MTFEGPGLAWFLLALLPVGVPAALVLIVWPFLRLKSGFVPLAILVGVGLLSAFSIGAYLDSTGSTVGGEVLDKREMLVYHLDGTWNRKMLADIRYRSPETELPVTESLNVLPARFDELHQGDFVELRFSDLPGLFRITRLQDQRTLSQFWSWATDQPFLCCFVIGLLLVLAARLIMHSSPPMLFFLSGIATVGAWWISGVAIPLWQQSAIRVASLNTVSANVREIHPPYLGSGLQGWIETKLFTPYDLILLDLVPLGRSQPVLSVDMVDLGTANLRPGQSVNVEYSPGSSRFAIIPDATRSYFWKNGLISTLLASLALSGFGRAAFLAREKRPTPVGAQAPNKGFF